MLPVSKNSVKTRFSRARTNRWLVPLLGVIAVLLAYVLAKQMVLGIGLFAGVIGLAVLILCMANVEAGLYINIIYSFFSFHFSREFFDDNFPVGVVSNVLVLATFLGLFNPKYNIRKTFEEFARTPVARIFLINVAYITIELFNPLAHSFMGWYATARMLFATALLLFASYNVFTDYRKMRRFLVMLFILSCAVAGYGCYQQWVGLANYDLVWISADPLRFSLIFIAGEFRKFSTMSDPASFAIDMSSIAAFFIILLTGKWKFGKRVVLLAGVVLLILGMAYSGTRTANAMLLAGLVMFILLTINRRSTIVFSVLMGVAFLALMYGPFGGNPTVERFRTTFSGTKDESYNVRMQNRKFIQPYIYRHPIGGGLGTTGAYGQEYNPGHYLAGFPTDSGYLRKALEIGTIGLLLIVLFYFAVVRAAIRGYFECTNPRAKLIYAAAAGYFFSFYVAEYAQDAIGQITDIVVYYPMIALVLQLKKHENEITLTQQTRT